MLLLLSNDDGIHAPGMLALKNALSGLGELRVVAPFTEQSAKSHSFTMREPVAVEPLGGREWAVHGTPADCVYLGVHRFCEEKPDWVVSGINLGGNLCSDVHYSGTVAAAREGALHDVPSVAVSLYCEGDRSENGYHWATAERVTRKLMEDLSRQDVPEDLLLNVNVPNLPFDSLRGIRLCPLGRRYYAPKTLEGRDGEGRRTFCIGGPHERFDDRPGTDGVLADAGWVTVTPLSLLATDGAQMRALADWIDET
jgi:5'-nucleotidase